MCVRLFSLIIFFLPGFIQSQNSNRADPLKQQTYLNQNSDNALLMEKKRNECLHLATTYTNKGNKDSAIYFMEQALIYGYSDLDEILNLCFIIPKSIKKEVYFRLVHTSDINFIKQHIADSLLDIKLLCRFVYFNDQFARIYSQTFEAKCIQQADSINQMKIIALLSDERINSVKYDMGE